MPSYAALTLSCLSLGAIKFDRSSKVGVDVEPFITCTGGVKNSGIAMVKCRKIFFALLRLDPFTNSLAGASEGCCLSVSIAEEKVKPRCEKDRMLAAPYADKCPNGLAR